MPRRKMDDGQVPCPRAECSTTLSRNADIQRHIEDIHDVKVYKWCCPYPNCKFKGASRRDYAVSHIKEKHLMKEQQSNTVGRIDQESIFDGNPTSQLEANRGGASLMTPDSSFQALTNSSFNNPPLHNAYATSHAASPSATEHLTMTRFVDYESSYPSATLYSTATPCVKHQPPMSFHSDDLGADEDSQVNSTDISGNNWSEGYSLVFDATVWDEETDWENFEAASNGAYTHDWNDDQN